MKSPAAVALQETVTVPEPDQLVIGWQVSPAGDDVDGAKATGPVKPPTAVTVITEEPESPVRIAVGEVAPAESVKSGAGTKWKVSVPLSWCKLPIVPVTITV